MNDPQKTLSGKTALITGAAHRLGRALALALAGRGANIVVHYNHSQAQAVDLCEEIRRIGPSAWPVQADLMDQHRAETLFADATAKAGPIAILINNASIFEAEKLWDTTDQSLSRNLKIHTLAPLILSRALAAQNLPAHIINLLDSRITTYDTSHTSYHLTKHSLLTLTGMLALELAPLVAVNAVAPGLILPPHGKDESYLQNLAHTNPLNTTGKIKDVTDAVLFLLESSFITGQIIYVDGGFHLKGNNT